MASDGSIVIEANIDPSQADKELAKLKNRIKNLEQAIQKLNTQKLGLEEQARNAGAVLDEAKARLEEMKAAGKGVFSAEEIAEQKERVRLLQQEYNRINNALDRTTARLNESNADLASMRSEAGDLQTQIDAAAQNSCELNPAIAAAEKSMQKFTNRVINLARRVFVFTLITKALRSMRDWLGKAVKSNAEAAEAIGRLKGALLTMAQPLLEVIIPAFTALVNVLAQVVSAIATVISALFGKTAKQSADAAKSLYDEQKAIKSVGGAAKDASKSLASFDEINKLAGDTGGGGSSTDTEIAPIFSDGFDESITDKLRNMLEIIGLIGAGLALWKISGALPGVLGTIAEKLAGIALTVGGVMLLWDGLSDAWENGIDWGNLIEMIGGLAAAALGLYLVLGPVASGIMLVVGGLALLVTGFHDAFQNGWTLQNVLTSITGIIATGLGISLLTGSFIPALIAAVAAAILAITIAFGDGEKLIEDMKLICEGFVDFFFGVFKGDIEKAVAGINKIFTGLRGVVDNVVNAMKNMWISFLNWLDEKTGGKFHGIIEAAKQYVTWFYEHVAKYLGDTLAAAEQAFTGIITFLTGVFTGDWDKAWQGVQEIFKGVWNNVIALLEGAINIIVDGLNFLIKKMNTIKFDVPDWVPGIGGDSIGISIPTIPKATIPRLAQGAVIPPNREFLAVLGDQKSGQNVEAPAALIKQMVAEALAEAGYGGGREQVIENVLKLDGEVIYRNQQKIQRRHGNNFARA